MIRDTWRAVLTLVVGVLLLTCWKALNEPVEPTVIYRSVPSTPMPTVVAPQPVPVPTQPVYNVYPQYQPQPERPLRRVASSLMELGDSMIGVIR